MRGRAAVSDPAGGVAADSARVFVEFHRRLRAFVSRRVRNAADADDIVQEAFLRIHRHLAEVRGMERLSAWVFQVARSAMADHYRRHRPGESLNDDYEPVADAARGGAEEFEELATCLRPMIEALPPADRQAVELADIRGLTQREASSQAGVTLSGMKSRVQRGRRKLKAMLLECCHVELDRRGGLVGHEVRDAGCGCRGDSPPARPSPEGAARRCC
jgi:RNA polymerase sigma-70 factor (ECF subfamily)